MSNTMFEIAQIAAILFSGAGPRAADPTIRDAVTTARKILAEATRQQMEPRD
jgi:hypothetical protein